MTRGGETADRPGASEGDRGGAGEADRAALERFDELLEPIRAKHGCPALAAAVARTEGVVAAGVSGFRKEGSPERVALDDRFHLGSCTKAMTATLVASLVEEGRLSWATTIGEALPELGEAIRPELLAVTLEHLLLHRSGLPEDRRPEPMLFLRLRTLAGPLPDQRRELARLVLGREPASAPGAAMHYANAGYAVAGAIAEAAARRAFEDLLRERLFTPLGMRTAGFGAPGSAGTVDQPRGHRGAAGSRVPFEPGPLADNPPAFAPAGGVHASIADFARFAALHLRGARGEAALLRPESFRKLHADPYGQGYAMGFGVAERDWAGGRVLTHAGSNTLFFAVFWIAPERGVAFVAAANAGDESAAAACDDAVSALVRRYAMPRPSPAVAGEGP